MSKHDLPVPEGKDPALWEKAQNRANFKSHAAIFVIINVFFWAIWLFTGHNHDLNVINWSSEDLPWPMWCTLSWGVGLAFHFASAYIFEDKHSVEKEYDKLIDQQKK